MATFGTPADAPVEPAAAKPSIWFTIEGVLLILLGAFALVDAFVAGAVATSILGFLIFLGGVLGLVATFGGGRHTHRAWSVVSAVIAIVAGLLIAVFPVFGASALALVVAAYLLFDGVSMIMLAFDQRRRHSSKRWGWLMAAGVADIVLAVLVLLLSPVGAATLIGVIVAVDLVFAGVALIALGRGTRLAIGPRVA